MSKKMIKKAPASLQGLLLYGAGYIPANRRLITGSPLHHLLKKGE